ncbi:MAG TPA: TIR domain-containing protein [Pyrinomonadaceae bacterium]
MTHQFSYDVFLSHSNKDKHIVRPLAERLKNDGLKVWFDEWSIRAGDDIPQKIEEGLEQSRVLVLCMSENAFGSDWTQLENQTFRFRDPQNKARHFVALRLDDSPIKSSLGQVLYVNWYVENRELNYQTLLEACRTPKILVKDAEKTEDLVKWKIRLAEPYVNTYAFSRDGKHVLTGSEEGKVTLWDLLTGKKIGNFKGHSSHVWIIDWSNNQRQAITCSEDATVRLWDIETGKCKRVLYHDKATAVWGVAMSHDRNYALSGSTDGDVKLWNLKTGYRLKVLQGHTGSVLWVGFRRDNTKAISAAEDATIRLWNLDTGRCIRLLGHTKGVYSVALSPDDRFAVSGSRDSTLRLWDLGKGVCLQVLEGHRSAVFSVAWSANGQYVISGSYDSSVRLWEIKSGRCLGVLEGDIGIQTVYWNSDFEISSGDSAGEVRRWDLSKFLTKSSETLGSSRSQTALGQVHYTNAKVLLVGESGAGKTGLTERLSQDTFTPTYSTSGTWSTQWLMQDLPAEPGWEREVWLWDFGGQADQRLIHQLYLDKTALILLVFNSDRDTVLPGLREWQQALQRSIPSNAETFLIAGRTDAGMRFDREKVTQFAKQNGYRFFETSAQSGTGCDELRKAIQTGIQWKLLERRTSPVVFKLLKDEIIELRDKGNSLLTFKELRELLRQRLPGDVQFTDADLETVVNLLDGPGVVKDLHFGTYILLRPEWLNIYAQAVIRTLKASRTSLGCLPVQSIAKGELIFQTTQADGKVVDEKRLKAHEETIVLQAMEQVLIERKLCLRQEGQLVFPSYYGLEQPSGPMPPKYFISYTFGGFLDDVYATLVVRLAYCGAFKLKELWRDAADFETLAEEKKMGVKLLRKEDGSGELLVHFEKGVASQEQVIFATYIHEHLKEKAADVTRLRFYVCAHCDTPVKNREVAMQRLEDHGEKAKIICVCCEKYVSLWDDLEKRFASESVQKKVALLRAQENLELDSRRKGKLLALEVMARITSADQKCFEIPGVEDEGLDIEVEFTDNDGRGTGKRLYLQLKAGNSYLQTRKGDGAEIFKIKKQSWVKYWLKQECPVLLVIGTFPEQMDERRGSKERFRNIRWMEISDLLRRESKNGTQQVRQIVFKGERLDTLSVRGWRAKALGLS